MPEREAASYKERDARLLQISNKINDKLSRIEPTTGVDVPLSNSVAVAQREKKTLFETTTKNHTTREISHPIEIKEYVRKYL